VEEVTVVHDKVEHNNQIIAVEPVEQKPEHKQEEKPENERQPEKLEKALPETPAPVPEEKFVVVQGVTEEVPQVVHEAISRITEEVRAIESVPVEQIKVVEVLVRKHDEEKPHSIVEKVQEIIEVGPAKEQLLVTAVVNTETQKVIVEDVKPVEKEVV